MGPGLIVLHGALIRQWHTDNELHAGNGDIMKLDDDSHASK